MNHVQAAVSIILLTAGTLAASAVQAGAFKINAAKDNSATSQPASVQFAGVYGVPETATEVDVVVIYRDARGIMQIASPGVFATGCHTELSSDGVDVTCPLVDESP